MESPSEKYFILGQMYQVIYQFCFCFRLEIPGVDLPRSDVGWLLSRAAALLSS